MLFALQVLLSRFLEVALHLRTSYSEQELLPTVHTHHQSVYLCQTHAVSYLDESRNYTSSCSKRRGNSTGISIVLQQTTIATTKVLQDTEDAVSTGILQNLRDRGIQNIAKSWQGRQGQGQKSEYETSGWASSINSRSSTRVRRSGLFYLNPDPAHDRTELDSAVVHLGDVTLDVGHLLVAWCTWDISELNCRVERDTRDRAECTERKPSILLQPRARRTVLDRAAACTMRAKGESHLSSGAPASPRRLMRVGVGDGFGSTLAKVEDLWYKD